MTTETHRVIVGGVSVEVIRKNIKNLHLGVYPPHGRVRVAAPLVLDDEAVRLAIIDKLGWIKRQRTQFNSQSRQSRREMVNGESHYFMGHRYRLRVREHNGPTKVVLRGISSLNLFVRPGTNAEQREALLLNWHRQQLRAAIPVLLDRWQKVLDVEVADWGIKKMKTKWGSCNSAARRIWLNLELAKKPLHCLEYIIVHELVHLIERRHNDRFVGLMDKALPDWRGRRELLASAPLGHEEWMY